MRAESRNRGSSRRTRVVIEKSKRLHVALLILRCGLEKEGVSSTVIRDFSSLLKELKHRSIVSIKSSQERLLRAMEEIVRKCYRVMSGILVFQGGNVVISLFGTYWVLRDLTGGVLKDLTGGNLVFSDNQGRMGIIDRENGKRWRWDWNPHPGKCRPLEVPPGQAYDLVLNSSLYIYIRLPYGHHNLGPSPTLMPLRSVTHTAITIEFNKLPHNAMLPKNLVLMVLDQGYEKYSIALNVEPILNMRSC
ncbi:hypothetical protein VNO77_19832 [Canavalia gladiata]|uniref:Uncharacterized protein n=1 Tax=Canavalia gladiata TaxID=3824 RepID=A0AAN9LN86_CANGL